MKRQAKPIPCPNKCGLRFIGTYDRVRDIEFEVAEHVREHCELRLVNCDFNGCFDSMRACDRRDHRARHLRGVSLCPCCIVVTLCYCVVMTLCPCIVVTLCHCVVMTLCHCVPALSL